MFFYLNFTFTFFAACFIFLFIFQISVRFLMFDLICSAIFLTFMLLIFIPTLLFFYLCLSGVAFFNIYWVVQLFSEGFPHFHWLPYISPSVSLILLLCNFFLLIVLLLPIICHNFCICPVAITLLISSCSILSLSSLYPLVVIILHFCIEIYFQENYFINWVCLLVVLNLLLQSVEDMLFSFINYHLFHIV